MGSPAPRGHPCPERPRAPQLPSWLILEPQPRPGADLSGLEGGGAPLGAEERVQPAHRRRTPGTQHADVDAPSPQPAARDLRTRGPGVKLHGIPGPLRPDASPRGWACVLTTRAICHQGREGTAARPPRTEQHLHRAARRRPGTGRSGGSGRLGGDPGDAGDAGPPCGAGPGTRACARAHTPARACVFPARRTPQPSGGGPDRNRKWARAGRRKRCRTRQQPAVSRGGGRAARCSPVGRAGAPAAP